MGKVIFIILLSLIILLFCIFEWDNTGDISNNESSGELIDISGEEIDYSGEQSGDSEQANGSERLGILTSVEDINLHDTDGNGKYYTFTYSGENMEAIYTPDNWKIIDSYRVKYKADMAIICQALMNEHPIHGKDMVSYRTIDDLVYEWMQHNVAYRVLPENNSWRKNSKDVDLDPKDQGLSLGDMYEARTGKKFNLKEFLKES